MDAPADIHFDGWTLRRQPRELLLDGARVKLQEQPLHVLEELLTAPGELVTREYLISRLWPRRIVEFDAALNAAVRRLRSALGDEAETPRYIETVPRQGYRFIGEVRAWSDRPAPVAPGEPAIAAPTPTAPARHAGRRAWSAGVAIALLVLAAGGSLFAAWKMFVPSVRPPVAANLQASAAMLRAGFFMQRRSPGDLERARKEYELELSVAPDQARAWAGLASVHWLEGGEGLQPREAALPKVREAAERALSLDPHLAEAHMRLAMYLRASGQTSAALDHCAQAAASEPDNPLVLTVRAAIAADSGRWDEAIAYQRRMVSVQPLSLSAEKNLADFLFLAGHIDEARAQFAKVLELDPSQPDEIGAFAEIIGGRYERALQIVQSWPQGEARDESLAMIYRGLGREAEAGERLRSLQSSKAWTANVRVAEVHAFRGEIDEAFHWLQNPVAGDPGGPSPMLYASPMLKPLHGDLRWKQFRLASDS